MVDAFELDEHQRQAVDEAHEIRAPEVRFALDPELLRDEELVLFRMHPVDDANPRIRIPLVLGGADANLCSVLEQAVDLPVGLDQAHRRAIPCQLLDRQIDRLGR